MKPKADPPARRSCIAAMVFVTVGCASSNGALPAGALGSSGAGGTSGGRTTDAGEPSFSTQFTDLTGWTTRNGRGDPATISIGSHAAAEDNSVLALSFPGAPSLGASDFQGPGSAVEALTLRSFQSGRFEMSVRFASCAPTEELVNGLFTYFNDGSDLNGDGLADNSEVDVEVLCGEPHLLWLTVWTDYQTNPTEQFRKTTRVVDMRSGSFQQTVKGRESEFGVGPGGKLAGITEVDFPNPNRFYVIGFEWQPTYVRYYVWLSGSEVELWRFEDASLVPQRVSRFLLNLWHAPTHWMKGGSAGYPTSDGAMLVDWVRVWQ